MKTLMLPSVQEAAKLIEVVDAVAVGTRHMFDTKKFLLLLADHIMVEVGIAALRFILIQYRVPFWVPISISVSETSLHVLMSSELILISKIFDSII